MNRELLYKLACFWNDRDTNDITDGMNVQTFMDWMEAQDPLVDAPRECVRSVLAQSWLSNNYQLLWRVCSCVCLLLCLPDTVWDACARACVGVCMCL